MSKREKREQIEKAFDRLQPIYTRQSGLRQGITEALAKKLSHNEIGQLVTLLGATRLLEPPADAKLLERCERWLVENKVVYTAYDGYSGRGMMGRLSEAAFSFPQGCEPGSHFANRFGLSQDQLGKGMIYYST